jgi:hypothetical protein
MSHSRPTFRWYQFSLRTLLLFVTLLAIPCSWLALRAQEAKREREAATAIEKLGGIVEWSEPSGPGWLRTVLGDSLFVHVEALLLFGTQATDAELENLRALSQLRELSLDCIDEADAVLEKLRGLRQLRKLSLTNSGVTDAGLEHLTTLYQLRELYLHYDFNITDKGLEHLKGLRQLRVLSLGCGSQVTDSGVKGLEGALPHCRIR